MSDVAPFPKPQDYYSSRWANRLIQQLDRFIEQRTKGDRVVNEALIGLGPRRKKVNAVTGSYQLLLTDHIVDVNATTAVPLTLPVNPTTGDEFVIQDSSGNASSNNISILPPSGINLNGAMSAFVISTDYGRVTAIYNGTQYVVA